MEELGGGESISGLVIKSFLPEVAESCKQRLRNASLVGWSGGGGGRRRLLDEP